MDRELWFAPCFLWLTTTVGMLTSTSHLDCTIRPKLHSIVAHAWLLCPFSSANRTSSSTSARSSDRMHWNMTKMWCDIHPEFPSSTRNLRCQCSGQFHRTEYRWAALALCQSIPPIANSRQEFFLDSLTLLHRNCWTWPVSIDVSASPTMARLDDSTHLQRKKTFFFAETQALVRVNAVLTQLWLIFIIGIGCRSFWLWFFNFQIIRINFVDVFSN